ncbi:hypothetical protein [Methylobacterium sp. ap11]|uniref:hypothetical protein n=1 Tax=Methylobacterium sp. ap11 TaxID=1761799 RepID=UPI001FCDE211|nr:hypothetical protein [Methylobacterium sp. ap11]
MRFGKRRGLRARILAKVEALDVAGSIKDRTTWSIVQAAEAEGRLVPGQLLVDLSSGNTGSASRRSPRPGATERSSTCAPRLEHFTIALQSRSSLCLWFCLIFCGEAASTSSKNALAT